LLFELDLNLRTLNFVIFFLICYTIPILKPHTTIIVAIIGLIIGIVVLLVISSQQPSQKKTEAKIVPTTTQKTKPDLKYSDESGYEFTYPQDLSIKPNDTLSDTQYSELDITSTKRKGNININVETPTLTNFTEWEDENKIDIKINPPKELKMADLSAQQYLVNKKTVTIAFDQGIIFTLTLDPADNPAYWITNYNKIISSFKIALQQEEVNTSGASDQTIDGGVEYEGEETIE